MKTTKTQKRGKNKKKTGKKTQKKLQPIFPHLPGEGL